MRGTLEVKCEKACNSVNLVFIWYSFGPHTMSDQIDVLVYGLGA